MPDEPHGSKTILLVEDEESLRRVIRKLLDTSGYTVLDAANSGEALVLATEHADEIDLVIADLALPDVMGPKLLTLVRAQRPDVPAIYISGYADESLIHGWLTDNDRFLAKPFAWAALTETIGELIGGNGRTRAR